MNEPNYATPQVAALVPMKGHSERVPRKNLRLLHDRPLYHWIIRALQTAKNVTTIVVETDSDEIAEDVATNFGVRTLRRPLELVGDEVPMNDLIAYHIEAVESDLYLQTHATNPLLSSATIDAALNQFMMVRETNDSLFSVTGVQTRFYREDGSPVNHNPDQLLPTQQLPVLYEENSNLYIFTRESFKNNHNRRIGMRPYMFEIDKLEAVDIDNKNDFLLAEALIVRRASVNQ